MKNTIRMIMKYTLSGISLGCTFFVLMCLFYSIFEEEMLMEISRDFTKQAIGAIIVGIACGGTAVIYQFERPSNLLKTVLHFCIGMGVFYPIALYLGWIPYHSNQIFLTALQFLFSCFIFMTIWSCFYFFNRNEAKIINQRLKELEQDHM